MSSRCGSRDVPVLFPVQHIWFRFFSVHCSNDGDFLNCAEFAPPDHEAKVKVEPALHDLVVLNKIFFFKELTSLMGLALTFFLSIFPTKAPIYIYSVS